MELYLACIYAGHSDHINKMKRVIDSVTPIKKVTVKANSKLWSDSNNLSNIKERQTLFKIQNAMLGNG